MPGVMGTDRANMSSRLARSAAEEDGFSLVEILVTIVITLVVVVGPLAFLIVSIKQQNAVSSRTVSSRQAETALERLTRDLREAMTQDASGNPLSVTVSNPSSTTTSISFDIPTPGNDTTPEAVTWTCPSTGATAVAPCTRAIGGATATEIFGVNSATFAPLNSAGTTLTLPATNPSYIGITVRLQVTSQLDVGQTHQAQGASNPIIVQTGVDLRNQA